MRRYALRKDFQIGGLITFIAPAFFTLCLAIYSLIQRQPASALLPLLMTGGLVYWYFNWKQRERIEWIELDSEELRFFRSGQIYKVSKSDSVRLQYAKTTAEGPIEEYDLFTPHGRVRIDRDFEDFERLLKDLMSLWNLKLNWDDSK